MTFSEDIPIFAVPFLDTSGHYPVGRVDYFEDFREGAAAVLD